MIKLELDHFKKIEPLLSPFQHFLITRAIIAGRAPGQIFVDQSKSPKTFFMVTPSGFLLGGSPENRIFNDELRNMIHNPQFRTAWRFPNTHLDLHVNAEWHSHLDKLFNEENRFPLLGRAFYFTAKKQDKLEIHKLPLGFHLKKINQESLDSPQGPYQQLNKIVETYWTNKQDFLDSGVGYCLLQNTDLVAWSITTCVSGTQTEIVITKDECFDQSGLLSILAATIANECFKKGFQSIGWHCCYEGGGMYGLAEKSGFTRQFLYRFPVYFIDPESNFVARAKLAFQAGQFLTAWNWLQKAAGYGSLPCQTLLLIARVLVNLNQIDKARQYLQNALRCGVDLDETMRKYPELQTLQT